MNLFHFFCSFIRCERKDLILLLFVYLSIIYHHTTLLDKIAPNGLNVCQTNHYEPLPAYGKMIKHHTRCAGTKAVPCPFVTALPISHLQSKKLISPSKGWVPRVLKVTVQKVDSYA